MATKISQLNNAPGSSFADNDIFEVSTHGGGSVYTSKKVSGLGINHSIKRRLVIPLSDLTTALTTGTSVNFYRDILTGMKIINVGAYCLTAPTGAAIEVDINLTGTGSILSTVISIDAGEKTSATASTPPVISTADISADSELTFDIDQIGSGASAGAGLCVFIEYKMR